MPINHLPSEMDRIQKDTSTVQETLTYLNELFSDEDPLPQETLPEEVEKRVTWGPTREKTVMALRQEIATALDTFLRLHKDASIQDIARNHWKSFPYRNFYPLSRVLDTQFLTLELNPEPLQLQILGKILIKVLTKAPHWKILEEQILQTYGGYGFNPKVERPSSTAEFRLLIDTIEETRLAPNGFAVYNLKTIFPDQYELQRAAAQTAPPKESPNPRRLQLTGPQQIAVQKLAHAYAIKMSRLAPGGFHTRPPLVIGASGSGKTTIVRALAKNLKLPLLLLDPTEWTVTNAKHNPATLELVESFITNHQAGLIAIDECDKFGNENDQSWWRGVRGEAMVLIEGRIESLSSWANSSKEALLKNFFVIGMGTWQTLHRKPEPLGFGQDHNNKKEAYEFETMRKTGHPPEELLARFGPIIPLLPPTAEDFKKSIRRIHRAAKIKSSQSQEEALVKEALESRKNTRWLEDHAYRVLESKVPAPKTFDSVDF